MNSPVRPTPHFHLGIVTGLQEEADIASEAIRAADRAVQVDSVSVECRGPGAARATAAAEALVNGGARALLSFGHAGGCDPALPSGTVILVTGVRDFCNSSGPSGETLWTNREWRRRLQSALLGVVIVEEAAIATTDRPLVAAGDKETLFWSDGVAGIDMESAAVARVAIEHGLPFMAVRAILDASELDLPPAALAGMSPDGRTRAGAVLSALMKRPQDAPGLARIAIAHRKATAALARVAAAVAPGFGAT